MARYKVTREPGAPIEGVGFIKAGFEFIAPKGYDPQTSTFVPLDAEALAAMQAKWPNLKFEMGVPTPTPKPVVEESLPEAVERFASRPPPKRV